MPGGLAALLDDVAAIAKIAAASVDDVAAGAGRAGLKTAGVVVDDTAVTPRYVTGFTPDRELPIIAKIAKGSLFNKLAIILPAALLLSAFLPWAITPVLMLGGTYLCYEGAEKVWEWLSGTSAADDIDAEVLADPAHEAKMVSGAIRTDFILSTEIMVIALAEVAGDPLLTRAIVLAIIAVVITVGVYGAVGLIVKMDDIGLHLAEREQAGTRAFGRGLVRAMPKVMAALSMIGIAAMIWVGGGIILHGLEEFGLTAPAHAIEAIAETVAHGLGRTADVVEWIVGALGAGLLGLIWGGMIVAVHHLFARRH
jgi:uncharacterized protein